MKLRNWSVLGLLAVGAFAAAPASATIINLTSSFDCSQANAGVGTCHIGGSGTGSATITFDDVTKLLSWTVTYSGMSGAATAAHFHGPATPAQNAGVTVGIGTSNPAVGSATLNATQETQLLSELWYINIHTALHGGGEIRGHVLLPEPAAAALAGLAALAFLRRRIS